MIDDADGWSDAKRLYGLEVERRRVEWVESRRKKMMLVEIVRQVLTMRRL